MALDALETEGLERKVAVRKVRAEASRGARKKNHAALRCGSGMGDTNRSRGVELRERESTPVVTRRRAGESLLS